MPGNEYRDSYFVFRISKLGYMQNTRYRKRLKMPDMKIYAERKVTNVCYFSPVQYQNTTKESYKTHERKKNILV